MTIDRTKPYPSLIESVFEETSQRRARLASAYIVPDENRCVQCGICSFSCPINVDVRAHALRGEIIQESKCLTCGECVRRCPRGVLRFEHGGER